MESAVSEGPTTVAITSTPSNPSVKTMPWGSATSKLDPIVSLNDVMSEELAHQLHDEEVGTSEKDELSTEELIAIASADEAKDDLLLAQMLQHEFDREHDQILKRKETQLNGQSKISVSYSNYRSVHPYIDDDVEDSEEEPVEPKEKKDIVFKSKRGITGSGKNIITKHDPTICGNRNASRVMSFPPEFDSGDVRGKEYRLPNNVYNQLKLHSQSEEKRNNKLHEKKEHSTTEQAVDPKTRILMYKMVNNDILSGINGIISTGKESVVFHADGGSNTETEMPLPSECVLKVFKTTLNNFKTREKYIRGDIRFIKDEFKKQNPRKIIKMWAEKEIMNLRKMKRCKIPCPDAILLKKHILLLNFLGKDRVPAPKLKDATLSDTQWKKAYEQTLEIMTTMYNDAQLIHGDFSEYNLLWHENQVWVIDVSQAVVTTHPHAHEFLVRDCKNVSEFFTKKGVPNVPSRYELFNQITGLKFKGNDEEFLSQIQDYEKNDELLMTGVSNKEYPFDYFYSLAEKERQESSSDSDE